MSCRAEAMSRTSALLYRSGYPSGAFLRNRAAVFILGGLVFLFFPVSVAGAEKNSGNTFKVAAEISLFRDGEKEKYKLLEITHPYSFDLKTIQTSMASLGYQERTLAWSKTKRVFGESAVKSLAPIILKKFAEAGPNERVVFRIATPKTHTEGDTFLTPQGLHWRFTVINRAKRRIDDFSVMGEDWRLVERNGQTYRQKVREELNNLVQDMTNWIVLPEIRPDSAKIVKTPVLPVPQALEKTQSSVVDGPDIKKKLQILEELRKEKLISEEEYKNKRAKVLLGF